MFPLLRANLSCILFNLSFNPSISLIFLSYSILPLLFNNDLFALFALSVRFKIPLFALSVILFNSSFKSFLLRFNVLNLISSSPVINFTLLPIVFLFLNSFNFDSTLSISFFLFSINSLAFFYVFSAFVLAFSASFLSLLYDSNFLLASASISLSFLLEDVIRPSTLSCHSKSFCVLYT